MSNPSGLPSQSLEESSPEHDGALELQETGGSTKRLGKKAARKGSEISVPRKPRSVRAWAKIPGEEYMPVQSSAVAPFSISKGDRQKLKFGSGLCYDYTDSEDDTSPSDLKSFPSSSAPFLSDDPCLQFAYDALIMSGGDVEESVCSSGNKLHQYLDCCSILFLLPDGYEFERDTLIQLWMAGEYTKDELMGHECFHHLLQQEYLSRSGTNFMTRKNKYKTNKKKIKNMLDCKRGNANSYLKLGNKCPDNINSTHIRHVSLVCNDAEPSTFRTLQEFSELRTLLFLCSYGSRVSRIPDELFWSLRELRTLDLSRTNIKHLPDSLLCLTHLHYLDLSWTLIKCLPEIICSLKELQTLRLKGCSKLCGLPCLLKKLTKLTHLDVDVLNLATLPRGIGALVNLQTLPAFFASNKDGCKIQELKELNSLTGDFCIAMLENVVSGDEAAEVALNKKLNLTKLDFRWTQSEIVKTNNCYDVLTCLEPCSSLEELQISNYQDSTFPDWISDPRFHMLASITLFKCEHVLELPLVERLPLLKHLGLLSMNGVEKMERGGKLDEAGFFRLEKLEVDGMQNLRCWKWAPKHEFEFTNLVELTLNDCPELTELHFLPCLFSLIRLEVRGCPKLKSLSDAKLPDYLEELIVEECPIIKRKCSQRGEDWYKIQHVSNIRISEDDKDDEVYDEDSDECSTGI